MSLDFNKAAMLLHVMDKAKDWPKFKALHDAAEAEILKLQEPEVEDEEVEEVRR